jgi:predicted amidohydrolase
MFDYSRSYTKIASSDQACFLPEAADFIVPTQEETYNLSQPVSSHTYTQGLQKLAKELNVWIAAGIHELPDATDGEEIMKESKEGKKAFNSHVAIDPKGEVVTAYRKASGTSLR